MRESVWESERGSVGESLGGNERECGRVGG